MSELMEGKVSISQFREVSLVDLLGREEVELDKNSAFSNNHSTAEEKNANTRFIADLTGLFIVITPIELIIKKNAKIKKTAISIFIIYY